MIVDTEILVLPYAGEQQQTVLHLLVGELKSGKWKTFAAAVAFAKASGNYQELLDALLEFDKSGGTIELTFGADTFGAEARGSEYQAIETLTTTLAKGKNTKLFLYHEESRTFHPKLYLFANEDERRALVIVGSSNWSAGGFHDNIEVNVVMRLDLSRADHRASYQALRDYFTTYWQETSNAS